VVATSKSASGSSNTTTPSTPYDSPPATNTPPTLTTVLPTTASYVADSVDAGQADKALVFTASATDKEDGSITEPSSFHWSNTTANCIDAGTDLCQNEVDGNNFTMNMPVSGVCPDMEPADFSNNYKFIVTVRDSGGLTDSREVDLTITYHCTPTPPELTITSPVDQQVYTMFDAGSGTYWIDGIQDADHWRPYHQLQFNATATDGKGNAITDQSAYTWQRVSGECNVTYGVATGLPCQDTVQGDNFLMNLTPGLINGPEETYVFDVSVRDSYGNSTTKQLTFGIVPWSDESSGQGN
jgi:hypothetical protein